MNIVGEGREAIERACGIENSFVKVCHHRLTSRGAKYTEDAALQRCGIAALVLDHLTMRRCKERRRGQRTSLQLQQ